MSEQITERIAECETVIAEMETSNLWRIVEKDCDLWIKEIDSRWQTAKGEQLEQLRLFKLAYIHLMEIKDRYKSDLEEAKKALKETIDDNVVVKDFDNK